MGIMDKLKSLKNVIAAIEKQFGRGSLMSLGEGEVIEELSVIPSGSLALDQALGIGGYPRGRIVEIYGPESSGKTTLTLHAMREAQRNGGVAAFIDAEHAFDPTYARAIGVDTERLLVSQPSCGEEALDIVEMLARSESVDVIVIDSVAALTPRAEIDGEMGDAHMGLQARLMSQALRKLTGLAHKTGTTIIFINQLRQKIGIDVRRIGSIKQSEEAVGSRTRAKVVKNKCAPPFREAEFDIRWGTGIDAAADLVDCAVNLGVLEKSGTHLSFGGEHLAQGRERAREAVQQKAALAGAIRGAVDQAIVNKRAAQLDTAPAA